MIILGTATYLTISLLKYREDQLIGAWHFDTLEIAMFLQAKDPLMAVIATTRAPAPLLKMLKVSVVVAGDAYLGDAQLALMVNGQQVGTATVTASHSSGQWQTLTFSVLMPASMQTIGISFLNDAYRGFPYADIDLFYVPNLAQRRTRNTALRHCSHTGAARSTR